MGEYWGLGMGGRFVAVGFVTSVVCACRFTCVSGLEVEVA